MEFWQKFIVRILKRKKEESFNEWVIMLAVMFIMESSVTTTTTHRQCKSETDDELASSSWAKSLLVVCPCAHHQILIHRFECNMYKKYAWQLFFRRRGNWPSAVACTANATIPTVCSMFDSLKKKKNNNIGLCVVGHHHGIHDSFVLFLSYVLLQYVQY